ncbi:hypothetical protein GN956_G16461 [Arapaima gigas]
MACHYQRPDSQSPQAAIRENSQCRFYVTWTQLAKGNNRDTETEFWCFYKADFGLKSPHSPTVRVSARGGSAAIPPSSYRSATSPPPVTSSPPSPSPPSASSPAPVTSPPPSTSFPPSPPSPSPPSATSPPPVTSSLSPPLATSPPPVTSPPSSSPSPSPPPENYVSRFLWHRILGALVILVVLIFIVDHLLFTRCPSGSSRRSREPQEDIGEF